MRKTFAMLLTLPLLPFSAFATCPIGEFLLNGSCVDCTNGLYDNAPFYCPGDDNRYKCPTIQDELSSRIVYLQYWPPNFHDTATHCIATIRDDDPDGDYEINAWFHGGQYGGGYNQTFAPYSCVAGKYSTIRITKEWVGDSTNSANCYDGDVDCMQGRVCTDVGTGYYSPDGDTVRYACDTPPANAHITVACTPTANSAWECDSGYGRTVNDTCEPLCTAGVTKLRTSTGLIYNLYANKLTSPAIHIQQNGITCYVNLVPGGATGSINVRNNGTVYHATN